MLSQGDASVCKLLVARPADSNRMTEGESQLLGIVSDLHMCAMARGQGQTDGQSDE